MDRQPSLEGFYQNVLVITLGITPGDPAGVGPELIRQCLAMPWPDHVRFEICGGDMDGFIPGSPHKDSAQFAWDALEEAANRLQSGEFQGVITGPICKSAMNSIGFAFPGQSEFFASRARVDNIAMCMTGGPLTLALVTIHEPISRVPSLLNHDGITRVGELLLTFLCKKTNRKQVRMAVAGLNPHAGEDGQIGDDEIRIIAPAVAELQRLHPDAVISGPISPDTVFRSALSGTYDGVLCMYHDQGLIPFKLIAFDEGVNTTLGLPFVRTSPDHGTAFDIAGKNIATPHSFKAAIELAIELCRPPRSHERGYV